MVVEGRYSQIFKLDRIRPAVVADGLAELQVRWPGVPIVFCESRQLTEEWTYRYLAAAHTWADNETAAIARISPRGATTEPAESAPPDPPARELRAWARANGLTVHHRGRLRPEILTAWHTANTTDRP